MQVLHSWPGDALKPLLSPVLVYVAHAELSLECPRFSYTPGLMWKDKSGINLLEEESCSRSPAACSMCVMISQSESLSHRPLMCPHCLGPFPEFHLLTFPGEILGFSPPVLQLGRVLQGVPGHTSASLWRYKWWMETNPLYQNKHPK